MRNVREGELILLVEKFKKFEINLWRYDSLWRNQMCKEEKISLHRAYVRIRVRAAFVIEIKKIFDRE